MDKAMHTEYNLQIIKKEEETDHSKDFTVFTHA